MRYTNVTLIRTTHRQLFCSPAVIAKTRTDLEAISLIFAPVFLRLPKQDTDLINGSNVCKEKAFVRHLLGHLPAHLLDDDLGPSSMISGQTSSLHVGVQAERGTTLSGIGGNGAGLAPRSRKTSTVRS